ncbi:MAG: amino acid permease [Candidatus Tyrphobacter sp.]
MKSSAGMERAIDTRSAVAINVITMIGIGPLITIPLVLATLGGSLALLGWIGGAVVALCDGLVWAELASRFPRSGGTYVYLRESFGHARLGRVLAFLFNWQFLLYAPCLLASGYIGFADYATYLVPGLGSWWGMHACALGIGSVTIVLLLRRTSRVAATSLLLGAIAVLTLTLVAVAALTHANWHMAMQLPGPVRFGTGLLAGFSSALFVTLYDYVGYADVALVGDEVREPNRTIPRSIVISVLLVAGLYVALQSGVLGVIPWRSLVGADGTPTAASQYVGSLVIERTWGVLAARIVTGLVLVTAFASLYGNLLGFSRIPFAAARDGAFFPAFARLHPDKHIPETALLAVGGLSLVASFFTLGEVIAFLTAGIVLIQSIMQIVALALVRRRGPAPFRMPLYPLPAIVALVGWILAFAYTGPLAIAIGIGWLVLGIAAYLVLARAQRAWPFAAAAATLLLLLLPRPSLAAPAGAWATWHASRVVQMDGYPVFEVGGKPFFVYGAAFFYERMPRDVWERSLSQYRDILHINTIDLYVPWNWQEPTQGHLDFTGRTNPRRDLIGVLKIIHRLGFKIVLRPGPVIRNEWRNGGYPAWLLERPEYDMPLHDVLEGRYPATATLQNQHADAAADEWLHNRTHLRYAARWLHDVLSVVAPYSHDVIAVALDDDQGAYLDNDTWPAPHWHEYVGWLKSTVRGTVGPHVPVFINTYEMKVTAASPAWAWGDWYQSDAYRIGEHDREQIDFSTDLLGTQSHVPVMMAEFQAGWLQAADENAPRPADPTNTALALAEFLADGAHGIVNFPVQDTIYPAGWEVPWANWAYDWDAALTACHSCDAWPSYGTSSARFDPTAAFGAQIARWGTLLAATHPVVDAHIVWPVSLFAAGTGYSTADFAAATLAMLKECRERSLICDIRDLRYEGVDPDGAPYVLPIVIDDGAALAPAARWRLAILRRFRRLVPGLAGLRSRGFSGEHDDATLLLEPSGKRGFVVVSNWESRPAEAGPYFVRLGSRIVRTGRLSLAPRSAALIPVREWTRHERSRRLLGPLIDYCIGFFPFGSGRWPLQSRCGRRPSNLFRFDPFDDGYGAISLTGDGALSKGRTLASVILAPDAGARIACLCGSAGANFAASIGLLRDAVDPQATPSPRDYIAAFTHPIPAGTFNRSYFCAIAHAGEETAQITCSYEAPDLPPGGADFERSLTAYHDEIDISERMTPHDPSSSAKLASVSGFAVDAGDSVLIGAECFGVYRPSARELGRLCWNASEVASHDVRRTRGAVILTLHFKRNDVEMRLGVLPAATESQARALVGGNT